MPSRRSSSYWYSDPFSIWLDFQGFSVIHRSRSSAFMSPSWDCWFCSSNGEVHGHCQPRTNHLAGSAAVTSDGLAVDSGRHIEQAHPTQRGCARAIRTTADKQSEDVGVRRTRKWVSFGDAAEVRDSC